MTDTEAMQLAGLVLRQWPNSGWGDETIAAFIVEMSKIGAEYETARQAVMSLRLRDTWQTVAVGKVVQAIDAAHNERRTAAVGAAGDSDEVRRARIASGKHTGAAWEAIVAARRNERGNPYILARGLYAALIRLHAGSWRTPEGEAYSRWARRVACEVFNVDGLVEPEGVKS